MHRCRSTGADLRASHRKGTLSLLAFSLLASGMTVAQPRVMEVQGEVSDGGHLRISGSAFGNKGQASPILFDQVDVVWSNGNRSEPYAHLADGDTVPTGDGFPWRNNTQDFVAIARNGGYSASRAHYLGTIGADSYGNYHNAWLETPRAFPDPATGEVRALYLTWHLRLSFDSSSQSGSHKFIRIRDTIGGAWQDFGISWTQMHLTSSAGLDGSSIWGSANLKAGEWARLEIAADLDRGYVTTWVNGKQLLHSDSFNVSTNRGFQPRLLGWNASGEASYPGETVEIADVYADSTVARVELCDSPEWTDCRIKVPQVPISWSGEQIEVVLHQGRLEDIDAAFLYVVDSSGRVNADGYAIGLPRPRAPDLDLIEP